MKTDLFVKKVLASFYNYKKNILFKRKIKIILNNTNCSKKTFDKKILHRHIKKWSRLRPKISTAWYKVYSTLSNTEDENYVPEDIYYSIIEPCLNNKIFIKAYSDKNFYELYYSPSLFPKTLIRNIDGSLYDSKYDNISTERMENIIATSPYNKLIVKPSLESGGGRAIILFIRNKNIFEAGEFRLNKIFLDRFYKRNYIVQEFIDQIKFFENFNIDSVNTIRVLTYRSIKDHKIKILHGVLRIGKRGMNVDNQAAGGYVIGIRNDGTLREFAIDKNGNKYSEVNDFDLSIASIIPNYSSILETCVEIANKNFYHRLLGFDLTINKSGAIKIIEINNFNNEINFYQMTNGSLFGEFTDEIIDFALNNPLSYCFDYTL